ncbi:MAG: hypothetical protein MUO35_01790, partial [Anaerolineales bacterium]|nr:hypothetical protein [Anaerolineales bacterium]
MESLLSEINAVIGVSGSFIGDTKGRILARALPSVYDGRTLDVVARTVSQTFAGLGTARRRKIGDIDMVFKEGRVVVKPFSEGFLGIVCVPRLNVALLNMTANLTVRKIHEQLKDHPAPVAAAPAAVPPAEAVAAPAPARLTANSPRETVALALVQAAGEHK